MGKRHLSQSQTRAFIKGTLIAVVICAVIVAGYMGLTQWEIVPVSPDVTSLYLGSVGDGILIWEKGMELPAASEELEHIILGE